jgi:hypothetical protein
VFWEFESKTYLCARFTQFTTEHNLLSQDQFIIPKDAKPPGVGAPAAEEGSRTLLKDSAEAPSKSTDKVEPPALRHLRKQKTRRKKKWRTKITQSILAKRMKKKTRAAIHREEVINLKSESG